MRPTGCVGAVLLLSVLCAAASADTENLEQFLKNCEAATQVSVPLRGDGHLEVDASGGTPTTGTKGMAAVMIVRPPTDIYFELREPGFKAVLLAQGSAYRVAAGVAKAEPFAAEGLLGASDFAREDIEPFQRSHFTGWRISDENANEVTVMLFPSHSAYSLEVITFDREKFLPLKTLYYRDTMNNLVKMRRDSNYVLIGRKWMPETISMETFKLRTHSTLALHWTQGPDFPPELFDPVFLPRLFAPAPASVTPAAMPRSE